MADKFVDRAIRTVLSIANKNKGKSMYPKGFNSKGQRITARKKKSSGGSGG